MIDCEKNVNFIVISSTIDLSWLEHFIQFFNVPVPLGIFILLTLIFLFGFIIVSSHYRKKDDFMMKATDLTLKNLKSAYEKLEVEIDQLRKENKSLRTDCLKLTKQLKK
ncbi:hypothetical protein [Streptococcus sp. S784/96/1]|uniref:hypothetical protein n=1 Tax=Streptococcus sp. S784/96/1 TaxID=2653499 RepID=UPI001386C878|nr:hypothetical protein [Streptococcus sp. S784/96/1]